MAKQRKTWVFSPPKPPTPPVPDNLKAEVEAKAEALVDEFLKPQFIKPPPKNWRWNYLIDIHRKWHRSFFYFIATYRSRGPTAIQPTFESPFARLEYVGNRRFNLAYMRHTGKWWEVHQGLTFDKCLKTIREGPTFQPCGWCPPSPGLTAASSGKAAPWKGAAPGAVRLLESAPAGARPWPLSSASPPWPDAPALRLRRSRSPPEQRRPVPGWLAFRGGPGRSGSPSSLSCPVLGVWSSDHQPSTEGLQSPSGPVPPRSPPPASPGPASRSRPDCRSRTSAPR
jgi:hypothetical protein